MLAALLPITPAFFRLHSRGDLRSNLVNAGKASETQETSRNKVNHMPLPDVSTGIKGKEVKGQRHSDWVIGKRVLLPQY